MPAALSAQTTYLPHGLELLDGGGVGLDVHDHGEEAVHEAEEGDQQARLILGAVHRGGPDAQKVRLQNLHDGVQCLEGVLGHLM